MKDRRDFLKTSLAVTAGIIGSSAVPTFAYGTTFPAGVVYTKSNPGKWAKKVGSDRGHITFPRDQSYTHRCGETTVQVP